MKYIKILTYIFLGAPFITHLYFQSKGSYLVEFIFLTAIVAFSTLLALLIKVTKNFSNTDFIKTIFVFLFPLSLFYCALGIRTNYEFRKLSLNIDGTYKSKDKSWELVMSSNLAELHKGDTLISGFAVVTEGLNDQVHLFFPDQEHVNYPNSSVFDIIPNKNGFRLKATLATTNSEEHQPIFFPNYWVMTSDNTIDLKNPFHFEIKDQSDINEYISSWINKIISGEDNLQI